MCERSASSSVTGADAFDAQARSEQRTSEHRTIRENYRTLYEVLQLPDVARPRMTRKSCHEFLCDGRDWLPHASSVMHRKMVDQQTDIFGRSRSGGSSMGNTLSR